MALLQKAYLGATPLFRDLPWFAENSFISSGFSTGSVNVTASASAHTKGNWSQLIASTSAETTFISFAINTVNVSATNTATLLDIGVGASGSETVIVPDIAVGGASTAIFNIPVKVPSGTRIAARCQSARSSQTVPIGARAFECFNAGSAALVPTAVDVLGINTATSSGTALSGASGTWVEIIASTAKDYIAFGIAPSTNDTDTAAAADTRFDIGVGSAGNEVEFGQLFFALGATENFSMRTTSPLLFGREVPSGSRLAIRHNIAANPSKYQASIIAIPEV
jgi:hypothetical protein